MNRAELTSKVRNKCNLSSYQAEKAVSAIFDVIGNELSAGRKVQVCAFGCFEPKARGAHQSINPRTRKTMIIPEKTAAVFHVSKTLKDNLG